MVRPGAVRDAYSAMSEQYIGLFDGPAGSQPHAGDESLVRRHLGGLAGPVLDLGCGPGRGSMTDVAVPDGSISGLLSWYSTIHIPPDELADVLAGFWRLLAPSGVLVIGFFDSDDEVAAFDHAVTTAYPGPSRSSPATLRQWDSPSWNACASRSPSGPTASTPPSPSARKEGRELTTQSTRSWVTEGFAIPLERRRRAHVAVDVLDALR